MFSNYFAHGTVSQSVEILSPTHLHRAAWFHSAIANATRPDKTRVCWGKYVITSKYYYYTTIIKIKSS